MEGIIYYDKQNREVRTYNPGGEYKAYVSAEKAAELDSEIDAHIKVGVRGAALSMIYEVKAKIYKKMWATGIAVIILLEMNHILLDDIAWVNWMILILYAIINIIEYMRIVIHHANINKYCDEHEKEMCGCVRENYKKTKHGREGI